MGVLQGLVEVLRLGRSRAQQGLEVVAGRVEQELGIGELFSQRSGEATGSGHATIVPCTPARQLRCAWQARLGRWIAQCTTPPLQERHLASPRAGSPGMEIAMDDGSMPGPSSRMNPVLRATPARCRHPGASVPHSRHLKKVFMQDNDRLNTSHQRRPRLPGSASQPAPRPAPAPKIAFEVLLPSRSDLLVLMPTPWEQGGEREQGLLARIGREQRIFILQPPILGKIDADWMGTSTSLGLTLLTPHLAAEVAPPSADERLRLLLNEALRRAEICDFILWYHSPQALGFTKHLFPRIVIWDQAGAAPDQGSAGALLASWADVTLTKGESLAEALRLQLQPQERSETAVTANRP